MLPKGSCAKCLVLLEGNRTIRKWNLERDHLSLEARPRRQLGAPIPHLSPNHSDPLFWSHTMLYPLKSWAKTNCSFMFLLTRALQRERKLTQRKTESRTKSKEVTWWLWGVGGHRYCLYVSDWMSPTSLRGLDTWCPLVGYLRKIRKYGLAEGSPSLGTLRFQKTGNISCTFSLLPDYGSRCEFSASSSSHLSPVGHHRL